MEGHRFRSNISTKALREFFNEKNNTPNKRYTIEQYVGLYKEYLKLLNEHERQQKIKQAEQRKIKQAEQRKIKKETNEALKSKIIKVFPNISNLRAELKKFIGKSVVVSYINKKQVIQTRNYEVPNEFSSWWKKISIDWWIDSEVDIFTIRGYEGKLFLYPEEKPYTISKINQLFRDGITHCVFTPIRNWAKDKLKDSINAKTKYRYSGIIKKIDMLEEKYLDGVPDDSMSEICNELQIDIKIELPFCENKFIECQSIKKRLRTFKFMNTRLNHIELNEIVSHDETINVSREELFKIRDDLDNTNSFYTYTKDMKNLNSINTLTKTYRVNNPFSEVVQKFEKETGLCFCKIDDIENYMLSSFINIGTNYNGTVDFINHMDVNVPIYHHDMKKAYANFKTCKFYQGFLGKITDFRQTDKMNGVGMYCITNLKFPDGEFHNYNTKLKIYIDNNVYTSPELEFLSSMGVTYTIVCGCWGVKPLDFEFNKEMLELRDDYDIPFYSKWTGVCDQHKFEKTFWMKGDKEYFKAISHYFDDNVVRWYTNEEGCLKFPKKHNFHLGHITAFITAYQRLNTLEQLLEIDYGNVIRVCVDGIYHTQENINLKNVFRSKNDRNFTNKGSSSYVSSAKIRPPYNIETPARDHYSRELHIGEGGSGKTHLNCNDKGFVKVLFIAPSWKLARCKKNEIGINSSVWARALSNDPEKIEEIKKYANVLIIDEISMLSEESKKQFFTLYSDMKIIMCGDLGYQLPCIQGDECNDSGFENIIQHSNDYRCKDPHLKQIKNKLREMIKNKSPKHVINNWVMNEFKNRIINVEMLKNLYKVEDMILSGTNEVKNYYTDIFKEKNKYYVTDNNRLYSNGDIVIGEKPENCKCEIRHCFTVHSIQGETAKNNLYIDSSKMFDARMFYTAISRARNLDQIFIIENKEITFTYEYGKIYKLKSKSGIYIGSTIKKLEERFHQHKNSYGNYQMGKGKYITSFKLLGDDDVSIELIENFRCNTLQELWNREAEIIKQFGNQCVNKTFNEQ